MDLLLRYEGTMAEGHPLSDRYTQITTGVPGRCPACGEFGVIASVDVPRGLQTQHCRACRYRWEYRFNGDGTILEVRGDGPLPPAATSPELDAEPDPPAPAVGHEPRRRVVVRRRQRPLRAQRSREPGPPS